MTRWFRLYDDVINDPKLLKLPESLRWAWVALLCVASKNGGHLPPVDDVALLLRVPEAKAGEYITKLVKAKLIDNENGVFVPHNWEGRQFKSDTSNDRVKRHRDNKRNVTPKQECNVTGSVTSTVTETAPEAEAETEADSEQSRADASAPVDVDLGRKVSALSVSVGLSFSTRGMPTPALNRCALWVQQGYTAGTILGAIERVLKRGKQVSTLDYFDAAIREDHAKAPPAASGPQIVSIQEFIIEGTPEWSAWNQHLRETTGKSSPVTDNRDERGILRRGWFRPTLVPPGYDEATGEKLAPTSEENAA